MKFIYTLLLVSLSIAAGAQGITYPDVNATRQLKPPTSNNLANLHNGLFMGNNLTQRYGLAIINSGVDSGLYFRISTDAPWHKVCIDCIAGADGSFDTTNIYNILDSLRALSYMDTAYVRGGTNTDTLFGYKDGVEFPIYVYDVPTYGVMSGGEVTPTLNAYCKNVATANFRINKVRYTAPGIDSICLAPCDSLPRIDVFYADTLGNIGVLTGTPDSVPVKPQVDVTWQVELSFAQIQCDTSGAQFTFPNNVYWGVNNIPHGHFYWIYDSTNHRTEINAAGFAGVPTSTKLSVRGDELIDGDLYFRASNTNNRNIIFGNQFNTSQNSLTKISADVNSRRITFYGTGGLLNTVAVMDSGQAHPFYFGTEQAYSFAVFSTRKGMLFPRLTTAQMVSSTSRFANSYAGIVLYNTDSAALCFWNGVVWRKIGGGTTNGITNISYRPGTVIDTLYYTNATGETNWYYVVAKDGLLAGGEVTYAGFERTYHITAAYIRKAGAFYSTSDTTITLPALSSPDSSRTDVFIANISGQNTSIQGVESANPLVPQINTDTDVYLTNVTITPTNQAGVDTTVIYDQNVEWTGSATGVTVNFGGTTSPYRGTKATDVGAINNNDVIEWTNDSLLNKDSYAGISGFWKLKAVMPGSNYVYLSFWNGTTQVSNEVLWPINKTNITSYQGLSLSMSAFTWTNNFFNKVRFRYSGGGAGITGWYSDFIYLQNGIAPPVYSPGITSLNGLTAAVQTFSNGSSGLAPNWSSAIANHTLNIPLASGSGVTSGTISKTEYDYFSAKEPAITAPYLAKYYYNGYKQFVASNTDSIGLEGATNLWFTIARARAAVSLAFTTTGTSGAATGSYNNTTGVFSINVPQYQPAGTYLIPTDTNYMHGMFVASFAKNTTRDSIILTLNNGYRFAVKDSTGGASGEANTASNLSGSGVGIWKDKSGVDLRFKRLVAGGLANVTDQTDSVLISVGAINRFVFPYPNSAFPTYTPIDSAGFVAYKVVSGAGTTLTGDSLSKILDIFSLGTRSPSNPYGGGTIRFITTESTNSVTAERMRIDKSGNVGITGNLTVGSFASGVVNFAGTGALLGTLAGVNNSSATTGNTFVGYHAGNAGGSIGNSNNTMLGKNAGTGFNLWNGATYNVGIGADIPALPTITGSFQFQIGGNAINWAISDVSGTTRRWRFNGTTSNISSFQNGVAVDFSGSTIGGLLFPTLTTTQGDGIASNTAGTTLYNTTSNSLNTHNGTNWTGRLVTSSAATLTLSHGNDYVFTGTTTTWTLPVISASILGRNNGIKIKNRGSGAITLNCNTGSVLYNTTTQSSITINAGEAVELLPDGTYFNILYKL